MDQLAAAMSGHSWPDAVVAVAVAINTLLLVYGRVSARREHRRVVRKVDASAAAVAALREHVRSANGNKP